MTAVISTTYDDRYLWFLPLTTWAWGKLGVDVVCFMPYFIEGNFITGVSDELYSYHLSMRKLALINDTVKKNNLSFKKYPFECTQNKEATYAQCSRLYGACLGLPEDEILVTGDIDMVVFKIPPYEKGQFCVFGSDLTPTGQFPICYASATVKDWIGAMKLDGKSYQNCLDELLGDIECENMRGNYWSKDQQNLWENTCDIAYLIGRARPGTQFADNRVDRDDANWRSYLNDNLIDAHLWRPGYTDENFANIMELMTTMYPNDDFSWLVEYNEKYKQLL